jgi:hypothetical protein
LSGSGGSGSSRRVDIRPCPSGGACSESHCCVEIYEFPDGGAHISFCRRFPGLKELILLLDSGKRLDLVLNR